MLMEERKLSVLPLTSCLVIFGVHFSICWTIGLRKWILRYFLVRHQRSQLDSNRFLGVSCSLIPMCHLNEIAVKDD